LVTSQCNLNRFIYLFIYLFTIYWTSTFGIPKPRLRNVFCIPLQLSSLVVYCHNISRQGKEQIVK
jgi:hypothetical protein